jgi:hypothetical protein
LKRRLSEFGELREIVDFLKKGMKGQATQEEFLKLSKKEGEDIALSIFLILQFSLKDKTNP